MKAASEVGPKALYNDAFITNLLDDYVKWIRNNLTATRFDKGVVSIDTPFLDHHNDNFRVYVVEENSRFKLTDDGNTISELENSGFIFNSETRKNIRDHVLRGFGVSYDDNDDELFVYANKSSFPQKKHALIQAMISIDNMYVLSRSRVAKMFRQDVKDFFDANDIHYSEDINLQGTSGLQHNFDFLINPSKNYPERLVKLAPRITKTTTTSTLFALMEVQEIRPDSKFYVIANTLLHPVAAHFIDAFENRGTILLPWDQRNNFVQELSK